MSVDRPRWRLPDRSSGDTMEMAPIEAQASTGPLFFSDGVERARMLAKNEVL